MSGVNFGVWVTVLYIFPLKSTYAFPSNPTFLKCSLLQSWVFDLATVQALIFNNPSFIDSPGDLLLRWPGQQSDAGWSHHRSGVHQRQNKRRRADRGTDGRSSPIRCVACGRDGYQWRPESSGRDVWWCRNNQKDKKREDSYWTCRTKDWWRVGPSVPLLPEKMFFRFITR